MLGLRKPLVLGPIECQAKRALGDPLAFRCLEEPKDPDSVAYFLSFGLAKKCLDFSIRFYKTPKGTFWPTQYL